VARFGARATCCGKRVTGELPDGLEAGRAFGPRLEATETYFQHQQHTSYTEGPAQPLKRAAGPSGRTAFGERTQGALHDLFEVTLSQGGLACVNEPPASGPGHPASGPPRGHAGVLRGHAEGDRAGEAAAE